MLIKEKVNLPRYMILTVVLFLGLSCFSSWELQELAVMLICAITTCLGNLVLTHCIIKAFKTGLGKKEVLLLFGKFLFTGGAVFGSVHFMKDLLILPIALYLGQLPILCFSLRRGSNFRNEQGRR